MALTKKGTLGLTLDSYGMLQTDRYGMSTATATWFQLSDITGVPITFGASHPVWSFLKCDKVNVSYDKPYWRVEASYFGVNGTPAAIYELDVSMSEEPVETHPDFADFAGAPGSEANGATFDAEGAFLGFVGAGANPEWVGVRSYLAPGMIWRKTYVASSTPPSVSTLGLIDTPEGSPPSVESGRTWMFSGLSFEQKGLVYQVRKEWRLSGRRGWNTTLYA